MSYYDPYELALETRDVSILEVGSSPVPKQVSPESCREGLREAGARRALARMLAAEAALDLADWVRAAHEQGLSVTEIARLGRLTRRSVYIMLEGASSGRGLEPPGTGL